MNGRLVLAVIAAGAAAGLVLLAHVSAAGEEAQVDEARTYHRNVRKMGDSLNKGLGVSEKGLGVRSKGLKKNLSPYSSRSFGSRGAGDSSALKAAHENAFASRNEVAAAVEPAKPDQAPPAAN